MEKDKVLSDYVWHPLSGAVVHRTTYLGWVELGKVEGFEVPEYVPFQEPQRQNLLSAHRSIEELKELEWPDRKWSRKKRS